MLAREEVYQEAGWFVGYGEAAELVAATVILIILPYGKGSQSYPYVLMLIHVVWHAVLGTWMECATFPDEERSQQAEDTGGLVVQCRAEVPATATGIGSHFPCSSSVLDACFTGCSSSELFGDGWLL